MFVISNNSILNTDAITTVLYNEKNPDLPFVLCFTGGESIKIPKYVFDKLIDILKNIPGTIEIDINQ